MIGRINFALGLLVIVGLGAAYLSDRAAPWTRYAGSHEVVQLTTPTGDIDRCPTCHRKALLENSSTSHPQIAGHRELARIGCTPCHGGQGRRLDRAAHEPALGAGPNPFLHGTLQQVRCARCHVPTGLAAAPALARGFTEYLDAACTGCHRPGRDEEGLGPDLRRLGRRTAGELRQALLDPRAGHPEAMMWSLRWRYDPATTAGRSALEDLLAVLLVFNDSSEPYRRAWHKPSLRVDVRCQSCHQEIDGGRTLGAAHRCTLLRERESLRCSQCHSLARGTAVRPAASRTCPQVRAARALCPVCHQRCGDGAEESSSP